jgi:hypothetical protein
MGAMARGHFVCLVTVVATKEERDSNGKVKSTKWSCCLVPMFSHHEFALTGVFKMI